MMIQYFKFAALAVMSMSASACAGLKQFTTDFESAWNDPKLFEDTLNGGAADGEDANAHSFAIIESGDTTDMDCDEARRSAKRALTLSPGAEWPIVVIAECNLRDGDAAAALVAFESVKTLESEPRVLLGRGVAQIDLGHYQEAISLIEEGLRQDNKIARGWNALGVAYDMVERYNDAVPAYEIAAELEPQAGASLNNLGMSYMRQGRYEEAMTAFKGALAKEPNLKPARLNLRIAAAMTGDYDRAVAGASDAEKASVYNNAGVAAMRRGDNRHARQLFQKALDVSPVFYAVAYDNLERLPRR